ncbi:LysR family transcriptional regulator [Paenibacillus caseinilyticus]|uniref:LysR family transcriptional regulator n=1 Tax=Paenibacillus mucilaginosus K02 TaxID=997761 RepID=I0BGW6_9BACL|nr:LysR family transcriptional regulator [Paenibacillus mucilaginosus]AFH61613.1 LysR family transcriptional regulator [Paenibacillus mucilaginosus K02]
MDERDWTILHLLHEHKNITKTAQLLYLSQPALTKRLMHIEQEFGVKIVNRGIRGVHFTPQGEYLAKRAEELLAAFREIRENVTNLNQDIAGTLRLGVSNYFGKYELPPLLKLFREQYPRVDYQLETAFSKDVFTMVYNHDIHIGFVRGDYSWPGEKRLLFREKVWIVSKDEIDLEGLPQAPRIDYFTDPLFKTMIDRWWADHYTKTASVAMKVDRADTCREMVKNGLGYSFLPTRFLKDMGDVHTAEMKDKNGEPLIRETWMFYHPEARENRVVNAFVEFIEHTDLEDMELSQD